MPKRRRKDVNSWERFFSRVDFTLAPPCWLWTGTCSRDGYPKVKWWGKDARAHRLAYEWAKGPIPEDLVLDHLCAIRRCVNPDHLEAVTTAENVNRGRRYQSEKTTCPRGHEYDGLNGRGRTCSQCRPYYQARQTLKRRLQRESK